MSQLSLYLDEDTLKRIEAGAKLNEVSVSRFVSSVMKEYFAKSWPEGFQDLFGSITDESFVRPDSSDWSEDGTRESL